jgi:hypothetical protein
MTRGTRSQDATTLQMALIGYEIERNKIEEKIREIQAALGKSGGSTAAAGGPKKRTMSAAARKRIAAAQKKRWALLKKNAGKE